MMMWCDSLGGIWNWMVVRRVGRSCITTRVCANLLEICFGVFLLISVFGVKVY